MPTIKLSIDAPVEAFVRVSRELDADDIQEPLRSALLAGTKLTRPQQSQLADLLLQDPKEEALPVDDDPTQYVGENPAEIVATVIDDDEPLPFDFSSTPAPDFNGDM